MTEKTVTATRFKSDCLKLIDAMNRDRKPVIVTRHGKPVAKMMPVETTEAVPALVGSMKGTVLRFDDPFEPALSPNEWDAVR